MSSCCGAIPQSKMVIMSCDGGCIKGEVARVAANIIAYRLRSDSTSRLCLGKAVTAKNTKLRDSIAQAPKVISIEGCPLTCGVNMLRGNLPDIAVTVVDASQLYCYDEKVYKNVFDLTRDQIEGFALKVVEHVEDKV